MRLIDVDALSEKFIKECAEECAICPMCDGRQYNNPKLLHCKIIIDAPIIDRPQGEWKPFDLTWGRSIWYCTACEESTEVPCDIWTHKPIYKYCPNCGADMRGDNDGKDIQSADE